MRKIEIKEYTATEMRDSFNGVFQEEVSVSRWKIMCGNLVLSEGLQSFHAAKQLRDNWYTLRGLCKARAMINKSFDSQARELKRKRKAELKRIADQAKRIMRLTR